MFFVVWIRKTGGNTSAFKDLKFGYACALAMVLFFIILVITLVQWLGQKKWVNYDA